MFSKRGRKNAAAGVGGLNSKAHSTYKASRVGLELTVDLISGVHA